MNDTHWTELEIRVLEGITSFHEMIPVGVTILHKMREADDRPIFQICGPMSTGGAGSLELNMRRFILAQKVARENGLYVFDQTPFQDAMIRLSQPWVDRKEYCTEILHIFYRGIFKTKILKGLVFLPGWESSVGTRWEREEALLHGLEVSEYPIEWMEQIST